MIHNPLHAAYYPDHAVHRTVEVLENTRIAKDTYRLRFECAEIARRILPGQFLMVRLADYNDPLIGRPLALYDVASSGAGESTGIDVVYLVKGKFTSRLAEFTSGQRLDVWGPLGNGFEADPIEHLIMTAGGIGQTPFLALAREYLGLRRYGEPPRIVSPRSQKVTLCYGARTKELLACVEDFKVIGVEVVLRTDDGSAGKPGLATDALQDVIEATDLPHRIVSCGPEPMMEAAAAAARSANAPCQVSLETPMACGIGVCFSCVTKVKISSTEWDYKRTCVDGPVFDANDIVWT